MKLNKLLPIAALTGTIAIAAPLTTSCSENNFTKVEYEVTQDNINDWEFQDTREGTLSVNKATDSYFDDLSKNPAILMDEIIASMLYTPIQSNDDPTANLQLDVKINDINPTNHRISFDYHIIMEMTYTDGSGNVTEMDVDTTYKLNNIEFCVAWEPEWLTNAPASYDYWVIKPKMYDRDDIKMIKLRSDKQWSLFIDSHSETYYNEEKIGGEDIDELTIDYKSEDIDLVAADMALGTNFVFYPSYYLHTAIPV